jgi:hypothetical protein
MNKSGEITFNFFEKLFFERFHAFIVELYGQIFHGSQDDGHAFNNVVEYYRLKKKHVTQFNEISWTKLINIICELI